MKDMVSDRANFRLERDNLEDKIDAMTLEMDAMKKKISELQHPRR